MKAQKDKDGRSVSAKKTRLIVYAVDAPAELHTEVEKYASKIHHLEGRKLNKSQAAAELLRKALSIDGFKVAG